MGKKKSTIPEAGTVPRDHPEYFGVREVPGGGFKVPIASFDPRPDWAKKWRAEMTFEDLRDAMEDMAVGTEEQLKDLDSRMSWIEEGKYDDVHDLGERIENTEQTVHDHSQAVLELEHKVRDIDLKVTLAVQQATNPLLQTIEDLQTELKEAFALIESLEDVIDGVA